MANNNLEALRNLNELHQKLKEVRDELAKGPRLVRVKVQIVEQKQAELEAGKSDHKAQRMLADQKSLQLKSLEVKLLDLQGKLNQAASNREYDILRGQVEADTVAKSVLEDEILETFDKIEAAAARVKELEVQLVQVKKDEAAMRDKINAAEPGLTERRIKLEAEVTAAEEFLPAETKLQYRRLVQAHGADAMAEVNGNTCTSCYVSLPAQTIVALRTGEILFCKICGKLMYVGVQVR
jgi:predicted  nucleic acid-binding Zn-ribbon protein